MRAESRQKILETARRLFAERGYDGCNVSEIAREAGMSQGNIYWYFSSKEEIFRAVLADGFEVLGTMMAEVAAQPGSGLEKLEYLLERYIALGREQGGDEFIAIMTALLGLGGVSRLAALGFDTAQIGADYHQSVSAILGQAQAEGAVEPGVDANLLTVFFFSFFNGLMMMYPREWKDIPVAFIREAAVRLLGARK
jgi:AcrR family transcriptional regulator